MCIFLSYEKKKEEEKRVPALRVNTQRRERTIEQSGVHFLRFYQFDSISSVSGHAASLLAFQ